jgi:putative ABC transport system permease protein
MNLLQLILKQMRQRALSSWLTLLSVTLGVALAIALIVFSREGGKLFGQTEYGYDLILGAKGSKLQLVLNAVYNIDQPPGTVGWDVFESLTDRRRQGRFVRWAVPVAATDSYEGFPVVATLPSLLGYDAEGDDRLPEGQRFEYRAGRELQIADGRPFHGSRFEVVLGSRVAEVSGLGVGDKIQITHGRDQDRGHEHAEDWEIVGILEPTRTSFDSVLFTPLAPSIALGEHTEGLEDRAKLLAEGLDPAELVEEWPDVMARGGEKREGYVFDPATGLVYPNLPDRFWRASAIFVNTPSGFARAQLQFDIDNRPEAMAAHPATEMRVFFERFLEGPTQLLLMVTVLVTVVAAVSILVSIYNSIAARRREIAIMRSLGATRARVLALICLEAGLIGLAGAILGFLAGHGLAAVASEVLRQRLGEGITWWTAGRWEVGYLAGVVLLAVLAGLVPALKAYKTPVAQNLVE